MLSNGLVNVWPVSTQKFISTQCLPFRILKFLTNILPMHKLLPKNCNPIARKSFYDGFGRDVLDGNGNGRSSESIIVNRWLLPFELGIETKFACTSANLLWGTSKFWIGGTVCLWILAHWQAIHSRAHWATSLFRPGQINLVATDCFIRYTPGWPKPWITSKILLLNDKGTNGLAGPLDTLT